MQTSAQHKRSCTPAVFLQVRGLLLCCLSKLDHCGTFLFFFSDEASPVLSLASFRIVYLLSGLSPNRRTVKSLHLLSFIKIR